MGLLISEQYRKQQRALHERPDYGVASLRYAPLVAETLERTRADELLDYGAGKGRLAAALQEIVKRPLKVHHYDPAIPEWAAEPQPCGFVACIDVLEHIEPDYLDNVLDELKAITTRFGFYTIHTGAAVKVLSDGWTAVTRDGSLSAHFEHTVAVTKDGPLVLTERSAASAEAR